MTPLLCCILPALLLLLFLGLVQEARGAEAPDLADKTPWVQVLDGDARIYLHHHFLSDEECDQIRDKAEKRLRRSGVVAGDGGATKESTIRTSDGMFFGRGEDELIEKIEKRLSEWTLTPIHNGEGLQVLRYKLNQKYDAHWDYFFDDTFSKNGENRYATVLMYLEAADEGGETVFPKVPSPHGINPGLSECAKYHLAVKPKKGDAILFHSMKPRSGELEERSMHGACPVLKGEKWSMTKWIHASHYNMGDKFDIAFNSAQDKVKEHQKNHDTAHAPAKDL